MERSYAQTSTNANATPRERRVPRGFASVLKFLETAGRVERTFTERGTAGTPDGAPMMRRRYHLEKTAAAIGIGLMGMAWRQPKPSHQLPAR